MVRESSHSHPLRANPGISTRQDGRWNREYRNIEFSGGSRLTTLKPAKSGQPSGLRRNRTDHSRSARAVSYHSQHGSRCGGSASGCEDENRFFLALLLGGRNGTLWLLLALTVVGILLGRFLTFGQIRSFRTVVEL